MNFSVALKDLHLTLGLGVQKTLVASDGLGHAYCKIHVKVRPVSFFGTHEVGRLIYRIRIDAETAPCFRFKTRATLGAVLDPHRRKQVELCYRVP